MHNAQHWYLIQYDIRCPKRGQKLLRFFKTCAFALQKSVFAWQGSAAELKALQADIEQIINTKYDDVRGYLINQPLLLFGASPFLSDSYFSGFPPHQQCKIKWLAKPPKKLFLAG